LPAPIAKSVSVAVAESETIRVGRSATVTFPLKAVIVAGKAEGVADVVAEDAGTRTSARALSAAARARRAMGASPSPFREGVEASGERQVF
jgi:hypothetical protein